MPRDGATRSGSVGGRVLHALVAVGLAAAVVLETGRARAEDVQPRVSPDLIDDVPSTKPDPYPAFDNFAWRAFVALAWPALTDPAHRGEPDRAKSLAERLLTRWADVFERSTPGTPG